MKRGDSFEVEGVAAAAQVGECIDAEALAIDRHCAIERQHAVLATRIEDQSQACRGRRMHVDSHQRRLQPSRRPASNVG